MVVGFLLGFVGLIVIALVVSAFAQALITPVDDEVLEADDPLE